MFKLRYFISALLIVCSALLSGCAGSLQFEHWYTPYTSGMLQGEGVYIEAEDGSFKIVEGRFSPPFQTTPMSPVVWTPLFNVQNQLSTNYVEYDTSLLDSFDLALKSGAKRVRVYHPGSDEPLYGVLLLNQRHIEATGAAARSYLIQIPDSYVQAAKGGRVSVVYEPAARKDNDLLMLTWVLWLSDMPF